MLTKSEIFEAIEVYKFIKILYVYNIYVKEQ